MSTRTRFLACFAFAALQCSCAQGDPAVSLGRGDVLEAFASGDVGRELDARAKLRDVGEAEAARILLEGLDRSVARIRLASLTIAETELAYLRHIPCERLCDLLQDPDAQVRGAAARCLGSAGCSSGDQVQALLALLEDPDWRARQGANVGVANLGSRGREVVLAILSFADATRTSRLGAIGAASMMSAEERGPQLHELIVRLAREDPDPDVRSAASHALVLDRATRPDR
jgi:HEAT repeat protein